jgi:hypothetical protein
MSRPFERDSMWQQRYGFTESDVLDDIEDDGEILRQISLEDTDALKLKEHLPKGEKNRVTMCPPRMDNRSDIIASEHGLQDDCPKMFVENFTKIMLHI